MLLCATFTLLCLALPTELYVSPAGSDSNDGSSASKAFLTLPHAQMHARQATKPVTVNLLAGDYKDPLPSGPLVMDSPLDSNVSWVGSGAGTGNFDGTILRPGRRLSKWTKVNVPHLAAEATANVWKAKNPFGNEPFYQLVQDFEPAVFARFPNVGAGNHGK